jgi:cephalosporin hydroxylase
MCAELEAYALLPRWVVTAIFDTIIEDMPAEMFPERPWRR